MHRSLPSLAHLRLRLSQWASLFIASAAMIWLAPLGAAAQELPNQCANDRCVILVDPSTGVPYKAIPVGGTISASDPNNAAFQGFVPMTVGTTYPAQRSLQLICTAAGNVSLTLADASVDVVPVQGSTGGTLQTLPYAVTTINTSGTTATCTYGNLK